MLLISIVIYLFYTVNCNKFDSTPITCGSAVKLVNKETNYNLHSHNIAWGSGSGQQSITSTSSNKDSGSLWIVKEGHNSATCESGEPIKCDSIIRLEHMSTGKNLHSHLFKSALSGNQEVSGYGESGYGDTGDNWRVVCESNDKLWMRGKQISFAHVDTGKYLYTAESVKFTQSNCGGGCPIMGQTEVSASAKKDVKNKWTAGQGVYITPLTKISNEEDDDEL
eukprot:gene17307-22846_t